MSVPLFCITHFRLKSQQISMYRLDLTIGHDYLELPFKVWGLLQPNHYDLMHRVWRIPMAFAIENIHAASRYRSWHIMGHAVMPTLHARLLLRHRRLIVVVLWRLVSSGCLVMKLETLPAWGAVVSCHRCRRLNIKCDRNSTDSLLSKNNNITADKRIRTWMVILIGCHRWLNEVCTCWHWRDVGGKGVLQKSETDGRMLPK